MSEIKHTRVPDPNDKFRGMYDDEPWAAVAKRAGLEPHNAESQARMVARSAACEIAVLLSVLRECREMCLVGDDDGISVSEDVVIPAPLFRRICAAIAKAEGR